MKQTLINFRYFLIPAGSRRETVYHAFRVLLLGVKNRLSTLIIDEAIYLLWIKKTEPGFFQLRNQRVMSKKFDYQPLLSIIVPVFNPSAEILKNTILSVLNQTYPKWELCIVDGNSTADGVHEILNHYINTDHRIKVKFLKQNYGISGNSNRAIDLAEGEFVVFLDHDDELAPDLLYNVVIVLNDDASTDFIYYDEDKISGDSKIRNQPWFKPRSWSPDFLLSANFLMHSVIRRNLIQDCGGFDILMDGAQDWDLALRITNKTKNIKHIPRILYHWRQSPGSVASDAKAKPWAYDAQKRCLSAHLQRVGVKNAEVKITKGYGIRIIWPVSDQKVSIIIPTKDNIRFLQPCLSSILEKTNYTNYEVILIDNKSIEKTTFDYYDLLKKNPRIKIIPYPHEFNYQAMNNLGARKTAGDILIFLNDDIQIIDGDWLNELVGWCARPEVGVVGTKLLRPDGKIQHAGIVIGLDGHGSHVFEGASEGLYGPFGSPENSRNYQAVTGACMVVSREVFELLNGFDEAFHVGYGDIDLCLRAFDQGYRIVYTPFTSLISFGGGTGNISQPASDVLRASIKFFSKISEGDPFYNPNLSNMSRIPKIFSFYEQSREDIILKILCDYDLVDPIDRGVFKRQRWEINPNNLFIDRSSSNSHRNILIVSHDLSISGASLILFELAEMLNKNNNTITVLSPKEGPLLENYRNLKIEVFIVDGLLEDSRRILKFFYGQDLLIANTILSYRTIIAAHSFQLPNIYWVHESKFGTNLTRSKPIIVEALQSANAVIFPSETTRMEYKTFSKSNNFYSIHNGRNIDRSSESRALVKTVNSNDKFIITQVASVEHRKGQDILLKALERLPAELSDDIECAIVGRILWDLDKSYCNNVIKMAKKNKSIQIIGEIERQTVYDNLERSDILIFPSRDEVFPLTIIEAMAFGKTVIATRVGGNSEIIQNGYNGFLVENEDYMEISNLIIRIYHNRTILKEVGENAYKTYQNYFTFDIFYNKLINIIDTVIMNVHK